MSGRPEVEKAERKPYSCLLNPARSLRSAPAQKAESTSLARMRTLVDPFPPSFEITLTCRVKSDSSCREIAFRDCGRLSDRILIDPECGAGTALILITGFTVDVALRRICCLINGGIATSERDIVCAWCPQLSQTSSRGIEQPGNSALRENMEERNMAWEVVQLLQLLCME